MVGLGVDASCVLAPVAVGETIFGYLAILADDASDDLDLQIVQHAANVYALSMMQERIASEVARQLKDELFEGLLSGRTQDEQVARERAMRLGLHVGVPYRVLVLVARPSTADDDVRPETGAQRHRLLDRLSELCARLAPESVMTVREDELVVLVPSATDVRGLGLSAVQHAAALLPEWRLSGGVGGVCSTAGAIARSYAQARRALETASRFGSAGDIVAFEDLGVYRLLFHVSDASELRGYTDQVLGPLIAYDRSHGADLVRTLACFLRTNGNLQATARELDLHVNSVTYRMQRIETIAGLDLDDAETRLQAQVALKILNGVSA
jgi:sugar diacid utilization regulator